jgi:DNA-binding transcriptional regulator LsrR (DeoR family)
MEAVRQAGAVGDICGLHYDIDGQVLDIDLNRRVMGVSLEKLTEMGCVIGVAGSIRKAPAILGALRAGYINVLFTDERAALEVLRLDALGVTAATFPQHRRTEMSLP